MRNERLEVHYSTTKPSQCKTREQVSAEIAEQTAAFMASGGNVRKVPQGASGFNPKPTRHLAPVEGKPRSIMRDLSKRSKAKYGSRVWNDGGLKK